MTHLPWYHKPKKEYRWQCAN